jgi:hypothetical protein
MPKLSLIIGKMGGMKAPKDDTEGDTEDDGAAEEAARAVFAAIKADDEEAFVDAFLAACRMDE